MRIRLGWHPDVAVTISAIFLTAGCAWILVTDILLYRVIHSQTVLARIETAKGWIFVGLSALLLYGVTRRLTGQLMHGQATTQAILRSIGDGVLLLGPDRTILRANPAAVNMLACGAERDLIGMSAPEFSRRFRVSYSDGRLVPPYDFVSQRVFDEGGSLHYKAILHPQGVPERVVHVTAAAVQEIGGQGYDRVVSVIHDVTDEEHLERLRDRFFASAAHALKTPVTVIKGHAQILRNRLESPLDRSAAVIDRQCGQLDRLIQNLLVLARVRSGTLRLHMSTIDLGTLVEEVGAEMGAAAPEHDMQVTIEARMLIYADRERIAIALRHVIDHAFRSSQTGAPVAVLVNERDGVARIGVRYRSRPRDEELPEVEGEYDDLRLGHHLATIILQGHSGTLTHERAAEAETTTWIDLPVAVEQPDGRA